MIPTPGHTPGSTCYLAPGAHGQTYLFTGDTIFLGDDGVWTAGYIPPVSDAATLAQSLRTLAALTPDLVISSAFPSETAVHVTGRNWKDCVAQALDRLSSSVSA